MEVRRAFFFYLNNLWQGFFMLLQDWPWCILTATPPPLPTQPHPLPLSPSFTLLQPFILLFLEHIRHISTFVLCTCFLPLPQMLFLQLPACQALSLISSLYSKVIFSEKEGNLMSSPNPEIFRISLPFFFFHLSTHLLTCYFMYLFIFYLLH